MQEGAGGVLHKVYLQLLLPGPDACAQQGIVAGIVRGFALRPTLVALKPAACEHDLIGFYRIRLVPVAVSHGRVPQPTQSDDGRAAFLNRPADLVRGRRELIFSIVIL